MLKLKIKYFTFEYDQKLEIDKTFKTRFAG